MLTQSIMGCKIEKLLFKYLIVPIRASKLVRQDWNVMIDKIDRRLQGWKAKSLSLGGRLIPLNVVLMVFPIYFLSIFYIPRWAREKNDRIC